MKTEKEEKNSPAEIYRSTLIPAHHKPPNEQEHQVLAPEIIVHLEKKI